MLLLGVFGLLAAATADIQLDEGLDEVRLLAAPVSSFSRNHGLPQKRGWGPWTHDQLKSHEVKKSDVVLRFGKRSPSDLALRFGKRSPSDLALRFGKRGADYALRFGKRATEGDFALRFGKRSSTGPSQEVALRFGRR